MSEKPKKATRKKIRYEYPADAISASDPLSKVIFFGRKFKPDERQSLLRADISMTMDQVSQIKFALLDNNFAHLRKGIFEPGIPVKYEDMFCDVGTVDIAPEAGNAVLTVKCRPRVVRRLKKRTGVKVIHDSSPSDFVRQECNAIGAKCVVQDSPKRNQVARDTKREKGDREPPSSWTTFKRLASEQGFVMFEAMNVIYFGKPTWLLDRFKDDALVVDWLDKDESKRPLTLPNCSRNEDTEDGGVTINLQMPSEYGRKFRPGKAVDFRGIPDYHDFYICTSVDYSLLKNDVVNIVIGTPVNPAKSRIKTRSQSPRTTSSMRKLLTMSGFKGDTIETAMAVAMAETKGNANYIDKTDTGATWGPYVGLFAIRSLRSPNEYDGLMKDRIWKKLRDAEYNAKFVHRLTNGGKDWSMFDSYTDNSYKRYYKKKNDYQVEGWELKLPKKRPAGDDGSGGSSGDPATGAKSATAFVTFALRQAGDAYVYGAEASGPNPSAFDCSELVEWAARQAGVYIPDGSSAQNAYVHHISVDQGIRTRGALLFHPGHVAISLGNGRTIEAANPGFGVGSITAYGRFSSAGLIPGMRY